MVPVMKIIFVLIYKSHYPVTGIIREYVDNLECTYWYSMITDDYHCRISTSKDIICEPTLNFLLVEIQCTVHLYNGIERPFDK